MDMMAGKGSKLTVTALSDETNKPAIMPMNNPATAAPAEPNAETKSSTRPQTTGMATKPA